MLSRPPTSWMRRIGTDLASHLAAVVFVSLKSAMTGSAWDYPLIGPAVWAVCSTAALLPAAAIVYPFYASLGGRRLLVGEGET